MFRAAAIGLLALSIGPASYAAVAADTAPVTVQVSSPLASEHGLSKVLSSAASGDVEASARDVERYLQTIRWLRLVDRDPEVKVTIERRERTETGRSTDKNGGVTINHRYTASASLQIGRDRDRVDAEKTYSQGPGSTRDDAGQFGEVAKDLSVKIAVRVAQGLNELRPNRPQAGFDHKIKYKMLIRGDGLEITAVAPGSPAAAAGFQVMDRIRTIDGEKGTDQMNARVYGWWTDAPGTRYNIEVERNKQRQMLQLSLLPQAQWGGRAAAPRTEAPRAAPAPAATARPTTPARSSSGSSGVEIKPGMTQAEVVRSLGEPQKKVAFGTKTLWTYDGFTVTFVDGKVTDVK